MIKSTKKKLHGNKNRTEYCPVFTFSAIFQNSAYTYIYSRSTGKFKNINVAIYTVYNYIYSSNFSRPHILVLTRLVHNFDDEQK